MTVKQETSYKIWENIIKSEYITTSKNDYRLSIEYMGVFNEDIDEETDPEEIYHNAIGAIIAVNEITGHNPETITAIYDALKDDFEEAGTDDNIIMINAPETRKSAYFNDYSDYNNTIKTADRIKAILETLEG